MFIPGIFIPGIFCVPLFLAELADTLPDLRRCFRRRIPEIFIPGICLPDLFLLARALFFGAVLFFSVPVLLIFIAGVCCELLPGCAKPLVASTAKTNTMVIDANRFCRFRTNFPNQFIVSLVLDSANQGLRSLLRTVTRTRGRKHTPFRGKVFLRELDSEDAKQHMPPG